MATEPVGRIPSREIAIRYGDLARSAETKRGAVSLIARPAVALNQFNLPIRSDISELGKYYVASAIQPLQGFLVHREGSRREETGDEFVIVGPRLTAEGINAFLYYAAPYKDFGIDTDDIINDWTALYSGTEQYEKLRIAHSTIPGWSIYEQSREKILGILKRDHPNAYSPFQNAHPDDVIIPVIHGRRDADGNITLSLDPLDDELRGLIGEQLPGHVTDPTRLDKVMGAIFVAAHSPDNAQYPPRRGYTATSTKTQPLGPTQVPAFVIERLAQRQARADLVPDNQDIQQSWLLRGYTEYLLTGVIPPIDEASIDPAIPPLPALPEVLPSPPPPPPPFTPDYGLLAAYIAAGGGFIKKGNAPLAPSEQMIVENKAPQNGIPTSGTVFLSGDEKLE